MLDKASTRYSAMVMPPRQRQATATTALAEPGLAPDKSLADAPDRTSCAGSVRGRSVNAAEVQAR
jgi:hypothetical protein